MNQREVQTALAVRGKYKNRKTTVNGITFDSLKEARRYAELLTFEKAGIITDLQRQVKFVLIPAQREPDTIGPKGGRRPGRLIERECSYIADFVYSMDGQMVVEDVKGYKDGNAYAVFKIKRKLMLWLKNITIMEI